MSKTVNYSEAQTAEMVRAYTDCETDESRDACVRKFADKFGKTVRSIRAKLVREGVYIAKTYKTKTGDKPETKEAIAQEIATLLGVAADSLGLEKATKKGLTLVRGSLRAAAAALDDAAEAREVSDD